MSAEERAARRRGELRPQPLPVSELAQDSVVAGVPVRVFTPPAVRGVVVHLHGGGFVYGSCCLQDDRLERLALACSAEVVSVEYRLAPEHPYPAGADDCEAVALALVRRGEPLAIIGESAGACLAVTTLVRLRDGQGLTPFRAAALCCGVYDLELPDFADTDPELPRADLAALIASYAAGARLADISPAHAKLHGLPPALFVVGERDPLRRDSERLAARWPEARLEVVPGVAHSFDPGALVEPFLA